MQMGKHVGKSLRPNCKKRHKSDHF